MKRKMPLLIALLVLLTGGVVHGVWTQRWGHSTALEEAARRLELLPEAWPGWQVEPLEMDREAMLEAGAINWWSRTFTLPRSGEALTVILMCGRPGRMSVHQPQYCYRGAGYTLEMAPVQRAFDDEPQPAQMWTTRLSRQDASGLVHLRIYWAWFGDGSWQAPAAPRWSFASLPVLYKLYVIRELPPRPEGSEGDLAADLLQELLPVFSRVLRGELSHR